MLQNRQSYWKTKKKYQVIYVSYLTSCICKSVKNIRVVNLLVRLQMVNYTKVSFPLWSLVQNTPYNIKSVLKIKIHADWLRSQIIGCLKVLNDCATIIHVARLSITRYWIILTHTIIYISCMSHKRFIFVLTQFI